MEVMDTRTTRNPLTMNDYRSNATVEEIARRIVSAKRVLLTTHAKPDGDGIGSTLAMWRALSPKGIAADIYLMGPVEPRLRYVAGNTPFHVDRKPPADEHDLVVVMDTGAWPQLGPIADWLRERHDRVIGIDHHAKGDDVAAMRIVDTTAASATQMLLPIIEAMGCEITGGTGGVAEALFVGLATDTGWFRYPSAGAEVMRVAARLLDIGVDKSRLYQMIEETARPQRMTLMARALASLEFALDGAVAIMTLRPGDFRESAGSVQDIAELVNVPMSVQSVRVSVLVAQISPNRTKFSFRSKPEVPDASSSAMIDVNLLAQRFGGGGHVHAAGASVEMDADEALAALLAALEETACRRAS